MKRALISVSDKTGVIELAKRLIELEVEIVSTGGTYALLRAHNLPVLSVEEVTHFPEMLEGRVKTLHPYVHGGILFKRNNQEHLEVLNQYNIQPIDIVIVNLYPFEKIIQDPHHTLDDAIENIDIGGPTLLRAAAKNFSDVCVVVDPSDYHVLITQLIEHGTPSYEFKKAMALKVFQHTAVYDGLIDQYLNEELFPQHHIQSLTKVMDLRYGENPHQQAAFYANQYNQNSLLMNAEQLQGKMLSYNNLLDANAAIELLKEFNLPTCVVIKHTNPCGVGSATTIEEAYFKAYEADKISIFGGIVALNQEVNETIAKHLASLFLEVILAPSFSEQALMILSKKVNVRLMRINFSHEYKTSLTYTPLNGGWLVQTKDEDAFDYSTINMVSGTLQDQDWDDAVFAMKVCKHVKSNAIVIARNGMTLGIGGGQSNRVGAARIALEMAQDKAKGAVLASDAFFPMPDTVKLAAQYGIQTIIQPGGSIKDDLSIEACKKHNITMILTGIRHFKHG